MPSVNRAVIVGHLGRDPEIRAMQNGNVCNMTVATSRRYKDAQGEYKEETEWHRIVFFGKMADTAGKYLKKGSSVYIEGRLRTREYTDKQGNKRYQTEIVGENLQFLSGKTSGGAQVQPTVSNGEDVPF